MGAASLVRGSSGIESTPVLAEYESAIVASGDDAEQTGIDVVYPTDVNLGIGMNGIEGGSTLGLRFTNVEIPRGTPITEAYLRFTAYAANSNDVTVAIHAEASDNAATFANTTAGKPTSRVVTSASVSWTIPAWTAEQVDDDTTSPNLAELVAEVTSRSGWVSGNALAFIITRHASSPAVGSNRRNAHSFDSDPDKGPRLWINRSPDDAPLEADYSNVGVINPFNATSAFFDTPFLQTVAVPVGVNVPSGVYGVRVSGVQLDAQARVVKHRPDGTASLLRVEGAWPPNMNSARMISLTDLPADSGSRVSVSLVSGALRVALDGVHVHTITPSASTSTLTGAKASQLKGLNDDEAYIPSVSFHEWHVTDTDTPTSVGAQFVDLTVEEDTPYVIAYLARGRGTVNAFYEFQMRLVIYKSHPWMRWEYTTFKHFDTSTPASTISTEGISAEALTITPASGAFVGGSVDSFSSTSLNLHADAHGDVTGDVTGVYTDPKYDACVAGADTAPASVSVAIRDFMGMGPCGWRVTTSAMIIDLWDVNSGEVFDVRGTGVAGETQAASSDYNASPRGTARTWDGFMTFTNDLGLVKKVAAKDDLWFMTAQALEDSEAFGPLVAAAGVSYAPWFKRVNAFGRVHELAAERHDHVGYAQYGLVPAYIPNSVNAELDHFVAREPMHSGRFGQSKDGTYVMGALITALLTNDRTRALRALRGGLLKADINGHHGMIFGSNYMGSNRDGVHRRYRDPWTGHANDQQYFYPESQYACYWLGGPRRHLERGQRVVETFDRSVQPYPQAFWGAAMRYMHTHSAGDLTKLNNILQEAVTKSNNSFPAPSALQGTAASCFWDNFRYGHNTVPAVVALYEATGNSTYLDELALAYRTMDFGVSGTTGNPTIGMSTYGQHTTPFLGLAYLLLKGYSASEVSQDAIDSMDFWIGDYIQAGTMRNHNAALPSGDPDTYDWNDVLSYFNGQNEEGPGFQLRFGPMIASWYAAGLEPPLEPGSEVPLDSPSLLGRTSFSTASPTWWNNTPITGDALDYYNGLAWYADPANWDLHRDGSLDSHGAKDDIYALARTFRDRLQAITLGFVLTGNLRLLDSLVTAMQGPRGTLAVGYRNPGTEVTWDASPYRCWPNVEGDQPQSLLGTDLNRLNEAQWHAWIMQYTYMLKLNIGKSSPAGHSYEDEYNFWIDYVENDWLPKWQGGGTSDWRAQYKGIRRGSSYDSPRRAAAGEWPPAIAGNDVHSNLSSAQTAYYYYLLSGSTNALAEAEFMIDNWLEYDTVLIGGTHLLWSQTSTGHGSSARYAMAASYPGYVCTDMVMMRVLGINSNITDTLLTRMARVMNDWFFTGDYSGAGTSNSATGLTSGDIAGEVLRGDMTSVNPQAERSNGAVAGKPYTILARWGGSVINGTNAHIQTFSFVGTKTQPRQPFAHIAELIKLAPLD